MRLNTGKLVCSAHGLSSSHALYRCFYSSVFCCLAAIFLQTQVSAEDWIYTVKPGDSLWKICAKHTSSASCWIQLSKANSVDKPKALAPGSKLRLPLEWLPVQPLAAIFKAINGDVSVLRSGTTSWIVGSVGESLQIGDRVRTLEGNATIQFGDGATLALMPNTEVLMDKLSSYRQSGMTDTKVRLEKGRVRSSVNPIRKSGSKYRIETPSAVAAVRGTVFRVAYVESSDTPAMLNEVLKGEVAVATEGEAQTVAMGFGNVTVKGLAPSKPEQLLSSPNTVKASPLSGRRFAVSWDAVKAADSYFFKLLMSSGDDFVLSSSFETSEKSYLLANLQPGSYRAVVNGIAASGLFGSEQSVGFTVGPELILAPGILDIPSVVPVGQAFRLLVPTSVYENIRDGEDAPGLIFEIDVTINFDAPVYSVNASKNGIAIPALNAGEYFIRYRWDGGLAATSNRFSPSQPQAFTVTHAKEF